MPLDSTAFAPSVLVTDLLAARDYIRARGWCQNQYHDTGGRVCALGAIRAVTDSYTDSYNRCDAACNALWQVLKIKLGECDIAAWNDEPGRTVENVLALYDLAIERAVEARN